MTKNQIRDYLRGKYMDTVVKEIKAIDAGHRNRADKCHIEANTIYDVYMDLFNDDIFVSEDNDKENTITFWTATEFVGERTV